MVESKACSPLYYAVCVYVRVRVFVCCLSSPVISSPSPLLRQPLPRICPSLLRTPAAGHRSGTPLNLLPSLVSSIFLNITTPDLHTTPIIDFIFTAAKQMADTPIANVLYERYLIFDGFAILLLTYLCWAVHLARLNRRQRKWRKRFTNSNTKKKKKESQTQ